MINQSVHSVDDDVDCVVDALRLGSLTMMEKDGALMYSADYVHLLLDLALFQQHPKQFDIKQFGKEFSKMSN
jgi:hypothetical protein